MIHFYAFTVGQGLRPPGRGLRSHNTSQRFPLALRRADT